MKKSKPLFGPVGSTLIALGCLVLAACIVAQVFGGMP